MSNDRKVYSATRVLDLASLLVLTASYAILFAGLQWLMFDISAIIYLTTLFTCVAIAQALLFGVCPPRTASLLVGLLFGVLFTLFWARRYLRRFDLGRIILSLLPSWIEDANWFLLTIGSLLGLGMGYMAGTCVGGVFLVSDALRRRLQPIPSWDGEESQEQTTDREE